MSDIVRAIACRIILSRAIRIPWLRSCFSYPSDFWLMYYYKYNDLYYKSFQSFSFYTYYEHHLTF